MTQEEITKWENENINNIKSWKIDYNKDHDLITFTLLNDFIVRFKRIK